MKKLISFLLAGIILLCASACSSEPAKGSYDCNADLGDGLSLKVTVSPDSENTKLYFVLGIINIMFSIIYDVKFLYDFNSSIDYSYFIAYNINVDGRNIKKMKREGGNLPFSHLETTNVILRIT